MRPLVCCEDGRRLSRDSIDVEGFLEVWETMKCRSASEREGEVESLKKYEDGRNLREYDRH